jgi:peptidoglycan/xylan/chitin deacetylase (PgdA/CDA1 family)
MLLDTIAECGYVGLSLEQVLATPGQPRVAITFDDGTRGQFDHAVPALRARGMTASFYVTTDWIAQSGYMTWSELRQLVEWGMSVQSHTKTHPFLSELGPDDLRAELAGSKAALDRELNQDTSELAFPGGDEPTRRLRSIVADTGYRTVVGSRWGINEDEIRTFPHYRPIRRCTARGAISPEWTRRVIRGDKLLGLRHFTREAGLRRLRSTVGASRYAHLRRALLNALSGSP